MENAQLKDQQIKAQGETIMTQAQLVERVQELEKQLAECLSADHPEEEQTPPKDAVELWHALERQLTYEPGFKGSYYEVGHQVSKDMALLGRISQEVTFAHLCRKSTSDFGPSNGAGDSVTSDQYKDMVFFLDRLSSALFSLKDKYADLESKEGN